MSANSILWGARAVGLPRALPRGGGTAQFEAVSPRAWTTGRGRRPPSKSPEPHSPAQLGAPEAEAPRQTRRKGTVRSHTGPTNPSGSYSSSQIQKGPHKPRPEFFSNVHRNGQQTNVAGSVHRLKPQVTAARLLLCLPLYGTVHFPSFHLCADPPYFLRHFEGTADIHVHHP